MCVCVESCVCVLNHVCVYKGKESDVQDGTRLSQRCESRWCPTDLRNAVRRGDGLCDCCCCSCLSLTSSSVLPSLVPSTSRASPVATSPEERLPNVHEGCQGPRSGDCKVSTGPEFSVANWRLKSMPAVAGQWVCLSAVRELARLGSGPGSVWPAAGPIEDILWSLPAPLIYLSSG